jgi:hypothetical protein
MDHREADLQPSGPTIQTWQIHNDEPPGPRYADYCALYNVWGVFTDEPPDIVGFFGYRKYLMPLVPPGVDPAHNYNWWQCREVDFDCMRDAWAGDDGRWILPLLATHDVLVAEPFRLQTSLITDFSVSRSAHDAAMLEQTLPAHWKSRQIYPYLFITRWPVFNRAMHEMDTFRHQLDPVCTGVDSDDYEYKKRPMAYVMERVWSLWLEHSGLSIKHLPLLHCWEKK